MNKIIELHQQIILALQNSEIPLNPPLIQHTLPIDDYFLLVQIAAVSPQIAVKTLSQKRNQPEIFYENVLEQLKKTVNVSFDEKNFSRKHDTQKVAQTKENELLKDQRQQELENSEQKMQSIVNQLKLKLQQKTDQQ